MDFVIVKSGELTKEQREHVLEICSDAYEEDFEQYLNLLAPAVHVLGYIENEPICHAAFIERTLYCEDETLQCAYVEAVATSTKWQGQGYGSQIMENIEKLIQDYDIGALSPSETEFYAKLGWEVWEGPLSFIDKLNNIQKCPDEEAMILLLPKSGAIDKTKELTCDWREGEVW